MPPGRGAAPIPARDTLRIRARAPVALGDGQARRSGAVLRQSRSESARSATIPDQADNRAATTRVAGYQPPLPEGRTNAQRDLTEVPA